MTSQSHSSAGVGVTSPTGSAPDEWGVAAAGVRSPDPVLAGAGAAVCSTRTRHLPGTERSLGSERWLSDVAGEETGMSD